MDIVLQLAVHLIVQSVLFLDFRGESGKFLIVKMSLKNSILKTLTQLILRRDFRSGNQPNLSEVPSVLR